MTARSALRTLAVLAATTLIAGCQDNPANPEVSLEQQTWASSLGINLASFTKMSTGIYYLDQTPGTGTTLSGNPNVSVYYAGYLPDGSKFDSRERPAQPITFGLSNLILGWQLGMQGMKVGGKRRLLLPAAFGYGTRGNGPVPPNANLVFDIELVSIQ